MALSSHSRSMVKPAGGSCVASQPAMALAGSTWVWKAATAKPSSPCTSAVTTASARAWLEVSSVSLRACGSIHTATRAWRVKASGSSSCVTSSLICFFSFLPGARPVCASIWAQRSSTLRRITEAGSVLLSIMYSSSHWPPTDSSSRPCSAPRGGTQPVEDSCEGPQGTKRRPSSCCWAASKSGFQEGSMRKARAFLKRGTAVRGEQKRKGAIVRARRGRPAVSTGKARRRPAP